MTIKNNKRKTIGESEEYIDKKTKTEKTKRCKKTDKKIREGTVKQRHKSR